MNKTYSFSKILIQKKEYATFNTLLLKVISNYD